ncbi:MAG: PspA/IM30 family protein [Nannocystis sp.]|nr:PspA/IM30 family protein [Nannocystis sp.]
MTERPGLLGRLKRAISATLNDAVEAVSDPGHEIALMLDDLADQIKQAERDLHQAVVDAKVMDRKLAEATKSEADWGKRAEQALRLGDEALARAALLRRGEIAAEKRATEETLVQHRQLIEDMKSGIAAAKSKHKTLNLRRGSLIAQARAHKKGLSAGGLSGGGRAGDRLGEIEDKIAQLEALNEVAAEDMSARAEEAAIDAKFARLTGEGGGDVDDALAALKAKIGANKALSGGKGDPE